MKFVFIFMCCTIAAGDWNESRLYKTLISEYHKLNPDEVIIPVHNITQTLTVNFGWSLISFLDYNDDTNVATLNAWETYSWKDAFLTWDPKEFGGIDHIHLPMTRIWRPDFVMYNGFDPDVEFQSSVAIVSYDGHVLFTPFVQRKVQCDKHDGHVWCMLKFGSWTYDGYRMDVDFYEGREDVGTMEYIPNNNYDLVEHSARKNEKFYPCCYEPYPDLTFKLKFKEMKKWWEKKK